jgi:hypothetical protein
MATPQYTSLGGMEKSSFFYTKIALIVERLEDHESLPELQPTGSYDSDLAEEISETETVDLFMPIGVKDTDAAAAVKAGILLWNDDLKMSHEICQGLETIEGSYWHGIMHRREGDFSNAKHWFAKVVDHPVYQKMFDNAATLAEEIIPATDQLKFHSSAMQRVGKWSPEGFVDWCESAANDSVDKACEYFFKKLQIEEIRLLIDHSYQLSIGYGY